MFVLAKTSRCYYGGECLTYGQIGDDEHRLLEAETLDEAIQLSLDQPNLVGYDVYVKSEKTNIPQDPVWYRFSKTQ